MNENNADLVFLSSFVSTKKEWQHAEQELL
jgi:hypothetical protein